MEDTEHGRGRDKEYLADRGPRPAGSLGATGALREQLGYGEQTKPMFDEKAKTTRKVVLLLECTVCKYRLGHASLAQ